LIWRRTVSLGKKDGSVCVIDLLLDCKVLGLKKGMLYQCMLCFAVSISATGFSNHPGDVWHRNRVRCSLSALHRSSLYLAYVALHRIQDMPMTSLKKGNGPMQCGYGDHSSSGVLTSFRSVKRNGNIGGRTNSARAVVIRILEYVM
jgi:hypothetical protein